MMSDTFDQTYADFSAARRAQIVARIEAACARAGRDVSEVSPVAVSKTVGTGELLAAWRAGWRRFAENRPQELTRKLAFVEQTCSRSTSRARHPSRASRLTGCAPAWTTSWPAPASACAAS